MKHRSTGQISRVMWVFLLANSLLLSGQSQADGAGSDLSGDQLTLELKPEKARFYLHERIPVTVTLLAGQVSVRNIQYPILKGRGVSTGKFDPPRQDKLTRDGTVFNTYAFSTTLIAEKSGKIELGPAELRCDQLAPASGAAAFFGGSEPRAMTVRSQPVPLTILPLPTRGRPADFNGAVGRFTLSRQVTPRMIHVGDPVTVTTRIEGVGNIDSFSCQPVLLSGMRGYPPQARRDKKSLTCEQVLVSEMAGRIEMPAESISFFDLLAKRYHTVTSPAVSLTAVGLSAPSREAAPAAKVNPTRVASLLAHWPPWAAFAGVLLILASPALFAIRRKRHAPENLSAASAMDRQFLSEAESALASDDPQRFYEAVFRLVQATAAVQCNLPPSGLTVSALSQNVSSEAKPGFLVELFKECDAVRYGQATRDRKDMARTLKQLQATLASTG